MPRGVPGQVLQVSWLRAPCISALVSTPKPFPEETPGDSGAQSRLREGLRPASVSGGPLGAMWFRPDSVAQDPAESCGGSRARPWGRVSAWPMEAGGALQPPSPHQVQGPWGRHLVWAGSCKMAWHCGPEGPKDCADCQRVYPLVRLCLLPPQAQRTQARWGWAAGIPGSLHGPSAQPPGRCPSHAWGGGQRWHQCALSSLLRISVPLTRGTAVPWSPGNERHQGGQAPGGGFR